MKLVSKNRTRQYSVSLNDHSTQVPQGPPAGTLSTSAKSDIDNETLEKLKELFDARPIWLRRVIEQRMPARCQPSTRKYISHVAYSVYTGPWRSCWIRYKYDPRKEPSSCTYQIMKTFARKIKNSKDYNNEGTSSSRR